MIEVTSQMTFDFPSSPLAEGSSLHPSEFKRQQFLFFYHNFLQVLITCFVVVAAAAVFVVFSLESHSVPI